MLTILQQNNGCQDMKQHLTLCGGGCCNMKLVTKTFFWLQDYSWISIGDHVMTMKQAMKVNVMINETVLLFLIYLFCFKCKSVLHIIYFSLHRYKKLLYKYWYINIHLLYNVYTLTHTYINSSLINCTVTALNCLSNHRHQPSISRTKMRSRTTTTSYGQDNQSLR